MTPVSRWTVQAFYQAYVKRNGARLADFIDDDVEWIITGPVDLIEFCGPRHGKDAVLALFEPQVPQAFEITSISPNTLLIDGDRAAMLGRVRGVRRGDRRTISYQIAHFVQFRDDKVVEFRALIDSLDAAEQVLGHTINLAPDAVVDPESDQIAV